MESILGVISYPSYLGGLHGLGMRLVNDGLPHVLRLDSFVSWINVFRAETITLSLDFLSKIVTMPSEKFVILLSPIPSLSIPSFRFSEWVEILVVLSLSWSSLIGSLQYMYMLAFSCDVISLASHTLRKERKGLVYTAIIELSPRQKLDVTHQIRAVHRSHLWEYKKGKPTVGIQGETSSCHDLGKERDDAFVEMDKIPLLCKLNAYLLGFNWLIHRI